MASDAQKLDTRLILQVPLCEIETALDDLNAAELTKLDAAIAGFEKVKFRAADIEVNGVMVKADKARQLYRDEIWNLLEMYPGDGFTIGRA